MVNFGNKFHAPAISNNSYPGSWTFLKGDSHFVASAAAMVLNHLSQNLNYSVPSPTSIIIHKAGSQIVSGIKVYLEMTIPESKMDVQALIYHPSFILHEQSSEAKVEKIFASSTPIFK